MKNEINAINETIAKKRLDTFQKIAKDTKFKYKQSLLNTKANTLFENEVEKDCYFGRDEYQNPVIVSVF